jgi:hypothetical protein
VERATALSHSGQGAESVLAPLRDQLELRALLQAQPSFPPEHPGQDEHHQ